MTSKDVESFLREAGVSILFMLIIICVLGYVMGWWALIVLPFILLMAGL